MSLVLAFHLWPSIVPGGFVGVDVFFVLSGFLITTRLLVEWCDTGSVDLVGFWRRRARRLVPALVLVVVVATALAGIADRDLLVGIGRQIVGAATFSTNWVEIGAGTDYFAATHSQLLNPLWSLAVEEQFYLLWPAAFVVMSTRRMPWRRSAALSLMVAGGSAVLMAIFLESEFVATRVYYGTDTHVFGLMIGAALAFVMADPGSRVHRPGWQAQRGRVGELALVTLVLVLVTLGSTERWTYQGGLLMASITTAIVIATLPGAPTRLVRLLGAGPLRWIGRRSYGIYLWHWPVLLIVQAALPARAPGSGVDLRTATVTLIITGLASAISFAAVERPIQQNGFRATFAHWRSTLGGLRSGAAEVDPDQRSLGSLSALRLMAPAGFAVLTVMALAAVVTAPAVSEAQQSVEEGQRLIAAQAASLTSSPTAAPPTGTSPSSSAPSTPPTGTLTPSPGSSTPPTETTPSSSTSSTPNHSEDVTRDSATPSTNSSPVTAPAATAKTPSALSPSLAVEPQPPPVAQSQVDPSPTAEASPTPRSATAEAAPSIAPPVAPPLGAIDGSRMQGLGDSVMSGAAPALFEQFPGINLQAVPNKQWGDAPAMVQNLLARGELRDIVVLNFGTNAGLVDDARLRAAQETFERIGPNRRVIVLTIVGVSGWVPRSNANLKQLASAYPNVTVVDWNAAVQNDPGLVHSDRTHPNLRGIKVYAALIAAVL